MDKKKNIIPKFAVVGKVNAGKSSVLATLLEVDDNQVLRISDTPGETTECQVFPVSFEGEEWIHFIDTPGFSRAIEAMTEIKKLAGEQSPTLDTLKQFCNQYCESKEFVDERQLLTPLIDGAGLLYVIDPSKPVRDTFIAEMEILRWTGRPRMALLNAKSDSTEFLQDWKDVLGSYFNLVRTFNAHEARFPERKKLLQSLLDIDESNQKTIQTVLSFLDTEWAQRREESVEQMITFLQDSLTYRASIAIEERDMLIESRKNRILEKLSEDYFDKIRKLESKLHKNLLHIYRHHLISTDSTTLNLAEMDLFSEETWEKWGLSRSQLTLAGGAAGATAGVAVDIGTGGLTHGFGTLLGAITGAATAFFKGGDLPSFGMELGGGLKMKSTDGKTLQIGPAKNENFPWILLDSYLHYYLQILSLSHAVRSTELISYSDESITRKLSSEQRSTLSKWFSSCLKGSPNPSIEPEVFSCLDKFIQSSKT